MHYFTLLERSWGPVILSVDIASGPAFADIANGRSLRNFAPSV